MTFDRVTWAAAWRWMQDRSTRIGGGNAALIVAVGFVTVVNIALGDARIWVALLAAAAAPALALVVQRIASAATAGPSAQAASPDPHGRDPWQQVLDALPEPVLITDSEGRLTRVNRAARNAYPRLSPGGHVSLFSRDPAFFSALEQLHAGGETSTIEIQERVPVERRLLVTISAAPGSLDGRSEPGSIIALRDLSEQDRLARMRADFVANASHELRTPLAALSGFIETLQGRAKDDPQARTRFLDIMSVEAARMTRLIEDLLSLSRVEIREHLLPTAVVDIDAVVTDALEAMARIAAETGTEVRRSGEEGTLLVRGDHDELVRVVQNLVQNAIKYGRERGHVTISIQTECTGGRRFASIAVSDDGPGIAPEHLPRLTERFYRVSAKTSREKGGTGLGLAIVKHIVNRHRGDLRITSTLGEGSTFTVRLDRLDDDEPAMPNRAGAN